MRAGTEKAVQSTNLAHIKFAIVWIAVKAQELILEITLYIMPSFEKLVSSEH